MGAARGGRGFVVESRLICSVPIFWINGNANEKERLELLSAPRMRSALLTRGLTTAALFTGRGDRNTSARPGRYSARPLCRRRLPYHTLPAPSERDYSAVSHSRAKLTHFCVLGSLRPKTLRSRLNASPSSNVDNFVSTTSDYDGSVVTQATSPRTRAAFNRCGSVATTLTYFLFALFKWRQFYFATSRRLIIRSPRTLHNRCLIAFKSLDSSACS